MADDHNWRCCEEGGGGGAAKKKKKKVPAFEEEEEASQQPEQLAVRYDDELAGVAKAPRRKNDGTRFVLPGT